MPRSSSFSNVTEQVVNLLREGMLSGRWRGTLPGRDQLAGELGVSNTTMEAAMRRLAKEGMLVSQGTGKRRRIVLSEGNVVPRDYRVNFLSYESFSPGLPQVLDLLAQLRKAGFAVDFAPKSLLDLGMDVKRVAQHVQQNPADAWIVASGSREVLEWFCQQPTPSYAYFGNKSDIPIAGCSVRRDMPKLIRRLVELGHRRIVLLIREEHLKPKHSFFATLFLEALEEAGITPSSYNLPEWGYQPEGLRRCLDSLYKVTPPTVLIVTEMSILLAVRDFQAQRGIIAPRDVSLISLDQNQFFKWCDPQVAHFVWDAKSLNRRVVRWAKHVAVGIEDRRQIFTKTSFVEGGTIGPAPQGR
ncbi:MAG: substrate-binding domain-containing protein [Verrucomicrobia bacterium]|nr:substrate-binding domain-containing protein [Verrucomicrobiota bacterium]